MACSRTRGSRRRRTRPRARSRCRRPATPRRPPSPPMRPQPRRLPRRTRASNVGVQSAWPQGMALPRAYLITLASVVPHLARARLALIWIAAAVAFLLVVQVLWGPPAGIVVQGALLGGLSALLALVFF